MSDNPGGTSLVATDSPSLVKQVANECLWNCKRPLEGRVEVIAKSRRLGHVVIVDRLGNLLINNDSDGWFDDILFAKEVARYLNQNRK